MISDQGVEPLHRDRTSPAGRLALGRTTRAGVIAIDASASGSAGAKHHAAMAGRANCQTGQQDRTRCYPRRLYFWTASMQLGLHLLKHVGLDDDRNWDFHDFVLTFSNARL